MSLAMKRLKNIGWLALVFIVAILLYPLSLNVAAMHSDLVRVDNKILNTKREISFLQAELRTRASLQQLEEWNEVLYGYAPPTADQFVAGERALAGLAGETTVGKPVLIAASQSDGIAPAGVIGNSPFAKMEGVEKKDAESVPTKIAMVEPVKSETVKHIDKPMITPRTERLAKMDEKLLSEDLLSDINKQAAKERKRR
jgi:hypothetical protein